MDRFLKISSSARSCPIGQKERQYAGRPTSIDVQSAHKTTEMKSHTFIKWLLGTHDPKGNISYWNNFFSFFLIISHGSDLKFGGGNSTHPFLSFVGSWPMTTRRFSIVHSWGWIFLGIISILTWNIVALLVHCRMYLHN